MFVLYLQSLFIFYGESLLHHFVSVGDTEQVGILIDNGADTAAPNAAGLSPIHVAVRLEQNDCVRLLLERGTDPNLPTASGNTPLITAITCKNTDAVRLLLKYRANPNIPNARGELPIFHAIHMSNAEVVELLLKQKAKHVYEGRSALLYAIKCNEPECVRVLLENGARRGLDKKDANGYTPAKYAAEMSDPSIDLLLAANRTEAHISCAKGAQFITELSHWIANSIEMCQKNCEQKKPADILNRILFVNRRLKRFAELLQKKKADVSSEVEALNWAPQPSRSDQMDSHMALLIQRWRDRLEEVSKLHRGLEEKLITSGGQSALRKWEQITRSRREFFENLFDKDVEASIAARALDEWKKTLTDELRAIEAASADLGTKEAKFKKVATKLANFVAGLCDDNTKPECSEMLARVSDEVGIKVTAAKSSTKEDGEERPVRARTPAKKKRPSQS